MKVYVLVEDGYDEGKAHSAFTTRKKAEEALRINLYGHIDEVELDPPPWAGKLAWKTEKRNGQYVTQQVPPNTMRGKKYSLWADQDGHSPSGYWETEVVSVVTFADTAEQGAKQGEAEIKRLIADGEYIPHRTWVPNIAGAVVNSTSL